MAPEVPEKEAWAVRHAHRLLGLLSGLAVLVTLGDPGITSDEPIDVKVGRNYLRLVEVYGDRVARLGPGSIGRAELDALFEDNEQHPPLGRWLLGLASAAFEPVEGAARRIGPDVGPRGPGRADGSRSPCWSSSSRPRGRGGSAGRPAWPRGPRWC